MTAAKILSDSARGLIADLLLIAAVVSAVLIPALRWMQKTTHDIVKHELGPMTEAVKGHQRTLESIARNELSQLLPNGGSSMRDQLVEIRDILRGDR